jgi:S-adenosyl-L-methionine hydrolase (adenosine-forming)
LGSPASKFLYRLALFRYIELNWETQAHVLITLTTDFGYQDHFVGVMKGVIFSINPYAQVIDLTHGIPPQNIMAAALLLQYAVPYFPPDTIHVVVVDPGVGSSRQPLLIEFMENYFVGPDNGVLTLALEGKSPTRVTRLSNTAYQRQPIGTTFDGRDVFAPAAAHLSLGIAAHRLGEPTDSWIRLHWPKIARTETAIKGEILHIDAFGNLFTNIQAADLKELAGNKLKVVLGGISIHGLSPSYAAVGQGDYVALINSWGVLEIAVYKGSAQKLSNAIIGATVQVQVDS